MNGHWGDGGRAVSPAAACSPQHRKLCDEARAAAAWLWIQSEVAGAFERFSKDLLAIHAQGLSAVTALYISRCNESGGLPGSGAHPGSTAGGGARDALNSLLLLCSETGAEADHFSSSLRASVVKPVDDALELLARAADATGSLHTPNPQNPVEYGANGEVQKAARRLQLAEEELTKAESSLHELRALFGSDMNSSLEQKATQRISRASRLKVAAQEALQQAVAASAAKRPQGSIAFALQGLPCLELRGNAKLLMAGNGAEWAEAGGIRAEDHHRRVSSAVLQSMKAAGKTALAAQQRSTGYVLHYLKDLQLFAAAEAATAGASGGFTGEDEQDMLPSGASDDLISRLYRPSNGAPASSQQQTNEATLRNLLRHQEKQLQDILTERHELRQQTESQQQDIDRQRKEIERQKKEIDELKRLRKDGAKGAIRTPQDARPKPRKQVTIQLEDSDEENISWADKQQQQNRYQGGERGELHGGADGEDDNTAGMALQLSEIKAGSADELRMGSSEGSPPAARPSGPRRPIEMAWVDVQLRYEAFLLTLRSLPLSSMTAKATEQQQQQSKRQQHERNWSDGEAAGWSSPSLSTCRGPRVSGGEGVRELHWVDSSCAASLAEAVESVAGAALPAFFVRCCRLAASAASPSPQGKLPPRSNRTSRMSVQQIQDRILWSKRQQQQQQEDASGRPMGPLNWGESDLQVLAYELLLLAAYHHSQYAAAGALLMDEEEALISSSSAWVPQSVGGQPQSQEQQQPQAQWAAAGTSSLQMRRQRNRLSRAVSFKRAIQGDEEEEKEQQQQATEAGVEAEGAGDTAQQQSKQAALETPSRQARKHRKSLARAMSFKLGLLDGDEETQPKQTTEIRAEGSTAGCHAAAEEPSTDLLRPWHPFSLPLEEWQERVAGRAGVSCSLAVMPARRRLKATHHWMSPSPLLQQLNEEVLQQLLQLARVCFELPSASSNKLRALITPIADNGPGPGGAFPSFLHPCDLRFRVCRLMEAWRVALCPAAAASNAFPRQQQQQQQQPRNRFLHGNPAAAVVRLDAAQGVRGALRKRATGGTASGEKKGSLDARMNSAIHSVEMQAANSSRAGQAQQHQQLAGDLGPPILLQAPQEKRKSKRMSAAPPIEKPADLPAEPQKREDPVFHSFVQRQLQLLHGAALSRCARLLKFLLPQRRAAAPTAAVGLVGSLRAFTEGTFPSSLPWHPEQLQQLYARERGRSDDEAFLFFLRSLICQDEAADPKRAPQAPAFLLYSKEETSAAIAAAAQLQLLPLQLLCCFYHIFACIFALQQLQRQQLWGEEEASVKIEEVSIHVTDDAGVSAGTGEAEAPLTWEVRTEEQARGGIQLLQLLQHSMSQAASLDSALRCCIAARGNNNPTLKQLAAAGAASGSRSTPAAQRLRPQHSLKPIANLLEVPEVPSERGGDTSDLSDGGLFSGSDFEGPERMGGSSSQHGKPSVLRTALRRSTLMSLRRRTLRTLESGESAAAAAAAASMLAEDGQQPLCLPREVQLSAYWCMDIPLLLSLLLLLGRCCADPTATNGLQLDAPSLVQGLLLVAHAAQVGTDPTCPVADEAVSGTNSSSPLLALRAARAGSGFPGVSLESVAMLVAACVWAAGSMQGSTSRHQQQQQQSPVPTKGVDAFTERPLHAQGSVPSLDFASADHPEATTTTEQQQQQQLLHLLAVASPSIVQPMRAEVVSSVLNVLTDFSGFLKRPSADEDVVTDEVGWLLGVPQAVDDDNSGDTAAATPAAAAATASAVAAPRADGPAGIRVSPPNGGVASGAVPPAARAGPLRRQRTLTLLIKEDKRKGGGTLTATADTDLADGLAPADLLLRVRGERLALSLRPSLLQQQDDDGEEGLWAEPAATFSGFLTRRLWLAADWWVIQTGDGDTQQCALRTSHLASCCYGLSALLPSRVELQQQEIASVQLLCFDFLVQLQQQLQDYRRHFEPQVLPLALSIWRGLVQRLLLLPQKQQQRGGDRGGRETKPLAAWPAVPEGWDLRALEALQQKLSPGFAGSEHQQQEDVPASGEYDSRQEGSWVWSVPRLLRGPSPLHDMLRCFIYRSVAAAAGRLLGASVSKLLRLFEEDREVSHGRTTRDASSGEEASEGAADPANLGAQAEAEENKIFCALASGIEALQRHVQSELLLYSDVFAPLLPLRGEHSLLVLAAAKAVLLSVVPLVLRSADRAAEDPESRGLPAQGGRAVLGALTTFERLTDELFLGGVLCVSLPSEGELVAALAPRFFASFSLHLSGLTDLLSQAFLRDIFAPANPPHALYSEKAIDGWCCIYGVVEAALDSFLPIRWLLPRVLQFLSELIASLCRSLTDPCLSQSEGPGAWGGRPLLPLLALRQLQRSYFSGLLELKGQKAAISESPLVEHFLTLHRTAAERSTKRHHKPKGWRGRMTQLVAGWEEEGKGTHGIARLGSAYLSGVEDDNSDDSSDQYEGPLAQTPRGPPGHGHGPDDDKGRSRSVFRRFFGQTGSRESSLARGGRNVAEGASSYGGPTAGPRYVVGMERLSAPVSHLLAAVDTLTDWEAAREKAALTGGQRPTSGLQRWMVRLHIVSLYLQRLPGLRAKLLQDTEKRIMCRCPRDLEAVQHLRQLQGRGGGNGSTGSVSRNEKDAVQVQQEEDLAEATALVEDAIDSITQKLQETAKEICSLTAAHLVYYELQGDIFGNLYAGEEGFSGMTLSRLLQAFPTTVEAFFCSAPQEWQDELASSVLLCLVEAWCLLLLEWGYGGHCFESKELEVLEADLDSLRHYTTDNEIFEEDSDVFDRVNDFFVMLDADSRCLASVRHIARQQDSPRRKSALDESERGRKSIVAQGRGGQTTASIFATAEGVPEGENPVHRRSRYQGREGSESSDHGTSRKRHGKSKGWGGVGRWMRGVYGSTSSNRDSSRASHKAKRDTRDDSDALGSRESPRRSLRFAI